MRTVTYQSLLDRLAAYLGEADGLSVEDAAIANAKINFFARLGWEYFFHPDITPIEKRYFRPSYSAAENITAGDERYFIAANAYFVALRDQAPALQAPAILSGGDYSVNLAYWADATPDPTGDDWAVGVVFALGDTTRNPDDGLIYQCHTAHTAGATFDATKFGLLSPFIRSIDYEPAASIAVPTGILDRGSVALGSGVSSGSVTGLGLSALPTVFKVWIGRPAGELNISAWAVTGTFSTDGFDFELDAFTDTADYVLYWEAFSLPRSMALGNGVSSGSVTGLALSSVPAQVNVWVLRPAGGLNLKAWVITGSITTDGFDFELSGVTDSADYLIAYELIMTAVAANAAETAIGDVRYIWDRNPETNRRAQRMGFRLRSDLVQVLGTVNVVWIEFRLRVPSWTGAVRSDAIGYATDSTVFDAVTGDFWTANQSVSAGQSPTTHPSKWDKVEFPYYLSEFVAQSAYAMLTNREEQIPENFNIQMAAGYPLLAAEIEKIERQQGQTRQLNVVSGRN